MHFSGWNGYADDPEGRIPDGRPSPPRRPGGPLPYREATEAYERKVMADYARDCAGRRVLERLEREPGTAADRVKRFERRLAGIPRLFEMKRALDAAVAVLKAKLARGEIASDRFHYERARLEGAFRAIVEREFGPGYGLGSEAEELANARCALSKARWELSVKERTGRAPGRLHGWDGGPGRRTGMYVNHGHGLGQPDPQRGINVSEDALIKRELGKGTPPKDVANQLFWMRFPQWKGVRLPKDCDELKKLHAEWRRAKAIVDAVVTANRMFP